MNTPKISEIIKKYWEWFDEYYEEHKYKPNRDSRNNFIRQSILSILDSIPLEERKNSISSGTSRTEGYNQACKEIKDKLNKIRL